MTSVHSWLETLQASDPDAYESIRKYMFTSQISPQSHITLSNPAPQLPQAARYFQELSASMAPVQSLDQNSFQQQLFPQGASSVQQFPMEYQTATIVPAVNTPINLLPPTQVIPTSNARGTPMVERQLEFYPSHYVSQFQQKMPNQQIQLQHPGQRKRKNVLDRAGRQTSPRYQHNAILPAEEDVSFGQYVEESDHRLSPSQQASIIRQLNDELPVPIELNDFQRVNLSPMEPQFGLSQYPPRTQEFVHSQIANPDWTQDQSGQFPSLSEGVDPVQQPIPQQSVLHHPLDQPPVQHPPLQVVLSMESTSRSPQSQPQPVFRGELSQNLIQKEAIPSLLNKPEIPRPVVSEQLNHKSVPPPLEAPIVDTAGKDPLLSSEGTLPNTFANSSKSQGPKEADSQLSPKEMCERTPILPTQKSPPTSSRTVANSPTTKDSELKQTPPLTSPKQSIEVPKSANTRRQTLLAVLKSVRQPLAEQESSVIDRILSLNFNQESLFAALVSENIITSESLGQFRTVFTSIDAVLPGSTAAPAQYHSSMTLSSSDDAPSQTTTTPPNSSLKRSHSTPPKPESKPATPKPSTKQTQHTSPKSSPKQTFPPTKTLRSKQLRLPMPSPVLKEKISKLFVQYAMETHRPEYIESITSIAKTAKTILQLETALKNRGIFTAQEIVKVEQRATMELRKEREKVQSSHSTSNDGVAGTKEASLEKDSVQRANAEAPSNISAASQVPAAKMPGAKRGRPLKVRTTTQNSSADASNQVAHGSNLMNGANLNGVSTSTNGAPLNSSASNGKECVSDPSAPQIQVRRPRKLKSEKVIIAQALPCRTDLDLSTTIASWPENQIARNILIAAGREIPEEESGPLNEEFETIKNTWPELKKADLRTLEWDVIDPQRVDLLSAVRKTLETVQKLPKGSMKSGRGRGRPPIDRSWLISSSLSSTQSGVGEFTKSSDIDNRSSSDRFQTQPLDTPPPMLTGNGVAETGAGSVSATGGNSPVGLGKGTLRRQSHSAFPVTPKAPVPNSPSTTSTPTTPETRGRKPKSDLTKTPVQIAEVTRREVTPQVLTVTPRKPTTPQDDIIADDTIIVITPPKSSLNRASPRQSATTRLVKRTSTSSVAKSTPKRSSVIDLTDDVPQAKRTPKRRSEIDLATTIPLAIPLNTTNSSDGESPKFTPSPPKPLRKQTGYKSYPCQWQACQAELHSFDTLEQHVVKIHGKPDPVTNIMYCLWDDCPMSDRGVREYQDREDWEFHVKRTHLLHIQHACSIQGCGEMFATADALTQHYTNVHNSINKRGTARVLGKRKFMDEDILPVIEVMPLEIARKNRAVYDGPSRSLSIGQNWAVDKKRKKLAKS